ncbi:WD40/YVTN/BNR-like repeat-containing protein [Tamlana crocina]|uniref:Oxidoreductase n=1 Tax=Tamlana crocina TaxID=393006 RepID=A0ABX1DD12_9FLAO|nr:oxidoreductase [Tamlana crocina]NJX16247.1 oxidoreductase [Tamlana crocina]
MKSFFVGLLALVCFVSCGKKSDFILRNFDTVEIETLLQDSTLSIRAIEILDANSLAFAASKNTYGLYNSSRNKWLISQQEHDSLNLEFRAVGNNQNDFFMLSVANPALLFKTGDKGKMELVYKEIHENVFYDAMDFWNDKEGIAIGDSTDGCLSVIVTRDGGETWTKLTCDQLPKGIENEGAFAASDTNIAIVGDHTWFATTAGRVYYSPDKAKTWQVFDTPIVKEKDTEGIYSIDFYDGLNGFAIGGDYTNPDANSANKIKTTDGGKTWQLVAKNQNPGYRSCVQYIPNSNGKELVAIGFKGIDFSNDAGETWKNLSDEGFYTIRFLNDSVAYAAGAGRISRLTFR